jgi:alcohol oxidase
MLMAPISSFLGDHSLVPKGQYACVANYTAYPYSRGTIHITSADVHTPPCFNLGIFSDANDIDLKKHIWAYKKQRELMRRTKFYRGELEITHPTFSAGSKAACTSFMGSNSVVDKEVVNIEYSAEDDKIIEHYVRRNIGTTWHSLGTAKMAPKEELGVVDKDLNVYGVQGLKVVDLSIVPKNVAANTCNTAMLVGEKGADIILTDLGFGKTT